MTALKKQHLVIGILLTHVLSSFIGITLPANAAEVITPCTASAATAERKHIVVRLGHYTDDLPAAGMAVGFAKTAQERGQLVDALIAADKVVDF